MLGGLYWHARCALRLMSTEEDILVLSGYQWRIHRALGGDCARSGAHTKGSVHSPVGRVGDLPAGVEASLKEPSEGGTGPAVKSMPWCEEKTELYLETVRSGKGWWY